MRLRGLASLTCVAARRVSLGGSGCMDHTATHPAWQDKPARGVLAERARMIEPPGPRIVVTREPEPWVRAPRAAALRHAS
jgi:hypothetical protein